MLFHLTGRVGVGQNIPKVGRYSCSLPIAKVDIGLTGGGIGQQKYKDTYCSMIKASRPSKLRRPPLILVIFAVSPEKIR